MLSQLALMAIAAMPLERWRSFRTSVGAMRPGGEHQELEFTPAKLALERTPE
jgi:hypothetical protein